MTLLPMLVSNPRRQHATKGRAAALGAEMGHCIAVLATNMSIVCAVAPPGCTPYATPFLDHVNERRSEKIRGVRAAYHAALVV
jgi:hypothetical protein